MGPPPLCMHPRASSCALVGGAFTRTTRLCSASRKPPDKQKAGRLSTTGLPQRICANYLSQTKNARSQVFSRNSACAIRPFFAASGSSSNGIQVVLC